VRVGLALALAGAMTVTMTSCSLTGKSSSPTGTGDISQISVSTEQGAKPEITVPTPFSVDETASTILVKGPGGGVKAGQRVTVQYVGINGTDGNEFDSSWGRSPSSFVLDEKQNLPGLVKGLIGVPVGSRVLIVVPPEDGYGVQGSPAAQIGPTDSLVLVVDLESARNVLSRATGSSVAPPAGLPGVKLDKNGKPTVTVPSKEPPTTLVAQVLIKGAGAKVQKSQQITVHYVGVIWEDGKTFDSSWQRGQPSTFAIGVGRVITGWDLGLVGQTVGSQVLLVIPPDQGYGANGNDGAGISGIDTLVFVVDILDAA
jgi:peptidylprolyl isomerase